MNSFNLNINEQKQPIERYWELMVGSCHASTALREDYRNQLAMCAHDLGFKFLRFHGIFNDDMSVVKKHFVTGELTLSFLNIDSIFDFLLSIGMKPFIELGFMPTALASGKETIFYYKGNVTPPADYDKWAWLIKEFVTHLISRYGRDEVRQWFFEVWNEPNLCAESGLPGSSFWASDMEEYFKLYEVTAKTIKQCDNALQVGGPATSNNAWIKETISFCKHRNVPLDFLSTHHYPTDVVLGYGVEDSLNFVEKLKNTDMSDTQKISEFVEEYVVFQSHLWENVDRGVLTQMAERAVKEADGLPVYYTEWSSLAGMESDGAFGASFVAKTVADNFGLVKGYSYWTFSDLFEESGMPSEAFFGGFGLLNFDGIPKAPYRVYQLLHKLGNEKFLSTYQNGTVDIYPFYKQESTCIQFLAINHNSLLHSIEAEHIEINIDGIARCDSVTIETYLVDKVNANAVTAWESIGSPKSLTKGQIDLLKGMSALEKKVLTLPVENGRATFKTTLSPMATMLVNLFL